MFFTYKNLIIDIGQIDQAFSFIGLMFFEVTNFAFPDPLKA
jgi:hypothetical protein